MEMCFELLAFGAIQFLDLSKANKNDEKLKTNTPSVPCDRHHDMGTLVLRCAARTMERFAWQIRLME
jgi:hypothetical protein